MSMKQIETLVFDYGGVIVNIDDASVVKAMESLGVTAFKRLIHVRKIKRLMHQYINGLVAEAETLKEMLSLCRKGTTTGDIEKVLEELCGNLPVERLEALVKLRKRYKVYLLSNINDTLRQKSVSQMNQLGYSTDELFDEVFLSYAMRKEKPSIEIYEEMTQQTGLNPATTLYFDDRTENAEAGKRFGFQSVLVKTNHLEEHQEWQEINKNIELLMTIDTTNLCSHLQKKLFEPEGVYYPIWQAMQNDEELTAVVRSRQLHIYRNSKKILILAGKAQPKIIREDKLNELIIT